MRRASALFAILAITSAIACSRSDSTKPIPEGPFLGQKHPGTTPELFAAGFVFTGFTEWAPTFTPDGRFLFFASNRRAPESAATGHAPSYRSVVDALSGPWNGNTDVYWVDARIVEQDRR